VLKNPEDFHKDLRRERLVQIAKVIASVREEAQRAANAAKGDKAWGTGCRAYERTCFALEQLAAHEAEWMKARADGQRFEIRIGEVPAKFCRDDAEQPSKKHRMPSADEQRMLRGLFADEWLGVFRFVLETNGDGLPERVVFELVDDRDEPFNAWDVWTQTTVSDETLPKPVEQTPPIVRPIDEDEDGRESAGV